MATLLDGKNVAQTISNKLQAQVSAHRGGRPPGLAVVLVGNDPASEIYVSAKSKTAERIGFVSQIHRLQKNVSQEMLTDLIETLNTSQSIDGILIQLPLPPHLPVEKILDTVLPQKDVDGFHSQNLGYLFRGHPRFIPCTPKGILRLLKEYKIKSAGKKVVIIGRSISVGRPVAQLFLQENGTVTICHSKTKDLKAETLGGDIIVVAAGKKHLITSTFIKKGAVVIDVGIHRSGKKLVGDVDFEDVSKKASYITPVPGGIGPMTIAMLLENTWESYLKRVRA